MELEALYEKKLYVESSNYLKLEQEKLEMENYYKEKIAELRSQNENAMEKLKGEFKINLRKVHQEYLDSKQTAEKLQHIYDDKLNYQENEHEDEVFELKEKHKSNKVSLEGEWNR